MWFFKTFQDVNLEKGNLVSSEEEVVKVSKLKKHSGEEMLHVEGLDGITTPGKHYESGPHNSLILKQNSIGKYVEHNKNANDKITQEEDHLETHKKENTHQLSKTSSIDVNHEKIVSLPDLIYKSKENSSNTTENIEEKKKSPETWSNDVRMLEVPPSDLQPAMEGTQLSYFVKSQSKTQKAKNE